MSASLRAPDRHPGHLHAPEAVAPPSGHPRFPRIDSLRAIAALAVLVTHTATFSGFSTHTWGGALFHNLDVGVPVFFVISGFLLYRPLVAADVLGAPRSTLGSYAWRRLLRIAPAYWLALTALAWYADLHGVFTSDWWRYYFFLQIYSHHTLYGGIAPAWTLCVEVSFYALLPLYARIMHRLSAAGGGPRRTRLELVILPLLAAGSVALRIVDLAGPRTLLINTILENYDWFAAGMAMAVLSVAAQDGQAVSGVVAFIRRRPGTCWLLALVVYVGLARVVFYPVLASGGFLYDMTGKGTLRHVTFGLIAALFVAPAAFPQSRGLPGRILACRVLVWLGLISYGIYLWHSPLLGKLLDGGALGWVPHHVFIVLTTTTTAAAVTAAALSYYVMERPILGLKNRTLSRRPPGPTPSSARPSSPTGGESA